MKKNYCLMDVPEADVEQGEVLEILGTHDRLEAHKSFTQRCELAVNPLYLYEYVMGNEETMEVDSFKCIGEHEPTFN